MAKYETFYTCPMCGSLVKRGTQVCDCGYEFISPLSKALRLFLSIVLMFVFYFVIMLWAEAARSLASIFFKSVNTLPAFVSIMINIALGAFWLGFILAPIFYGPAIIVHISDLAIKSKSGQRFRVFAGVYAVLTVFDVIDSIILKDFTYSQFLYIAFTISFFIYIFYKYPKSVTPAIPIYDEDKERYAQRRVDRIITEMFAGQTNPFTGLPIKSEDEYRSYLREFKSRQAPIDNSSDD